jgi:hypothetical protein
MDNPSCYLGGTVKTFSAESVSALLLLALVGCKADKVSSGTNKTDAGALNTLEPPLLDSFPEVTPNGSVAIRGSSEGARVIIQGGADGTTVTAILPGGQFCSDITLNPAEPTALTVYSVGDGLLSAPLDLLVTKDATAPTPPLPTCSGSTPVDCEVPEICTNEVDDNCNGAIDQCDDECNDCVGDAFEPNDVPVNVPLVAKGSYELTICPCSEDWFAFERNADQRISVTADFVHATVDIDMRLYKAAPDGTQGDLVATSASTTSQELIDEVVDETTLYLLRVYPFGSTGTPNGPYTLTIN